MVNDATFKELQNTAMSGYRTAKKAALRTLAEARDPRAFDFFCRGLRTYRSYRMRAEAARGLRLLALPQGVGPLQRALQKAQDKREVREIARALIAIATPDADTVLTSTWKTQGHGTFLLVASAHRAVRSESVRDTLFETLRAPTGEHNTFALRILALRALLYMGALGERQLPTLLEMLSECIGLKSWGVVVKGLLAIGVCTPELLDVLAPLASNQPNPVLEALVELAPQAPDTLDALRHALQQDTYHREQAAFAIAPSKACARALESELMQAYVQYGQSREGWSLLRALACADTSRSRAIVLDENLSGRLPSTWWYLLRSENTAMRNRAVAHFATAQRLPEDVCLFAAESPEIAKQLREALRRTSRPTPAKHERKRSIYALAALFSIQALDPTQDLKPVPNMMRKSIAELRALHGQYARLERLPGELASHALTDVEMLAQTLKAQPQMRPTALLREAIDAVVCLMPFFPRPEQVKALHNTLRALFEAFLASSQDIPTSKLDVERLKILASQGDDVACVALVTHALRSNDSALLEQVAKWLATPPISG